METKIPNEATPPKPEEADERKRGLGSPSESFDHLTYDYVDSEGGVWHDPEEAAEYAAAFAPFVNLTVPEQTATSLLLDLVTSGLQDCDDLQSRGRIAHTIANFLAIRSASERRLRAKAEAEAAAKD